MLKDVIVNSIKSYGWFVKVVSIVSVPILALAYIAWYVVCTLPKNIDENILLFIIIVDSLILGAFLWIWMGIINYLDENDRL